LSSFRAASVTPDNNEADEDDDEKKDIEEEDDEDNGGVGGKADGFVLRTTALSRSAATEFS